MAEVESPPCEKPFHGVRARRYSDADTMSRRHTMQGHTARKLCPCTWCRNRSGPTLERSANAKHHRLYHLEDEEVEPEYGAIQPSTLAEPFKLTDFELDGLDVIHSLDRNSAWETVPDILVEHSVSMPEERKLSDGRVVTTYQLAPAGLLMPDPKVADELQRFTNNIYEIRRHRPKLSQKIPTDAPEEVPTEQPLLRATLSCTGMRVPQTAMVRCNQNSSYWDVRKANGKPLEIDLGSSCRISHVTTQGRHPPLRQWPHVWTDSHTRLWMVEDGDYLPNHVPDTRYKGPFYNVRVGPDHRPDHRYTSYHEPMYVSRYELFWRADGGRRWHSLGTFEGNSDEVTEVAHSFAFAVQGGLRARYLRIVPLETQGGGGLRVGVYGTAAPAAAGGQRAQGAARLLRGSSAARGGSGGAHAADHEDACDLVEYRLTTGGARGFARDGKGLSQYKDMYKSQSHKCRRRTAQLSAAREAAVYLATHPFGDGGYDSDGFGDEPAVGGALLTEVEREELDLALALSASLAVEQQQQQQQHEAEAVGAEAVGAEPGPERMSGPGSTATLSDIELEKEGGGEDSESWCSSVGGSEGSALSEMEEEWEMIGSDAPPDMEAE
jgi:hypothetical protein